MNIPDKDTVLSKLPPYLNKWETVTQYQSTGDIVNAVLGYHAAFRPYYDRISYLFCGDTVLDTCDILDESTRQYIKYREETTNWQSTAVPNGILIRGMGDCKHFASFIAGCLDSIQRLGLQKLDWCYCFASYQKDRKDYYHVYVVCWDNQGNEILIDPTLDATYEKPVYSTYLKP